MARLIEQLFGFENRMTSVHTKVHHKEVN